MRHLIECLLFCPFLVLLGHKETRGYGGADHFKKVKTKIGGIKNGFKRIIG